MGYSLGPIYLAQIIFLSGSWLIWISKVIGLGWHGLGSFNDPVPLVMFLQPEIQYWYGYLKIVIN